MSLASFPRRHSSYNNDTPRNCPERQINFQPSPICLGHAIDPVPPAGQRPKPHRMIPKLPKSRPEKETVEIPKKNKKKEDHLNLINDFKTKGIFKNLCGLVEHKVKCAALSTDHLLDEKRKRLRELLLSEEVAYTTEYITMCQQANANREEELYKRASELKAKAERERQQIVEEKLFKQKVLSCDPVRTMITQKQLKELKKDQLWQIQEKYAKEEAKREEDKMYHDLMIKNLLAMKEDEEEIAKLEKLKQIETKEMFIEQLKWKEQKLEEERRLKEFERNQIDEEMRLLQEEQAKEKAEQILKNNKMKAEFLYFIEQERERKERRNREEKEIEQTFNELLKLEAEKEKLKETNTKEKLKNEMMNYLENCRKLKQKREEEEKLYDKMLLELNEKKRQQKDAERRRLKEAREELFQDVLKTREEQVKEKRERQRREAEAEKAEIELLTLQLEQQDKIKEEYNRRCAEQRREYHCQLMKQIQEANEKKRTKKEEEDLFVQCMKEKEEREIEELNVILNSTTIFPLDHPMKTFIKENPPKYPCLHPYI